MPLWRLNCSRSRWSASRLSSTHPSARGSPTQLITTPNPAKAPWYFLGLQELLHYFPPVVAGVLVSVAIDYRPHRDSVFQRQH